MKKIISLKILLLLCAFSSFAQLKKANQYYNNDEYNKAIPLYIGVLKAEPDNIQALEAIANSYRIIRDYIQAEPYYERLIKQNGIDPVNHLYYATVLKANNKPKEAKAEFKQYGQAFPSDNRVPLLIRSCDEFTALTQKVKQIEVSPFVAANTENSEFSPVLFNDKLVFISDKKQKLTQDKAAYLHVYSVDIKSDNAASAQMLPYPINSEFHDGPVSFNAEQNMMLITHVEIAGIRDTNRAKIYFSFLEKNKWSKPVSFEYNSNKYSVAHPVLSADGQQLFFSSDMFGGNGGLDIYVCQKQGESWGQPQNLGTKINTAGDEAFPYLRKDGTLFFASDGHSGFGGLDIFSAVKSAGKYGNVTNMGADLNSVADDFGIVFTSSDSLGYFSSDRQGGKGKDDIYKFTIVNTEMAIEGKVVKGYNASNIVKKAELTLLSETGTTLDMGTTDNTGYFKFDGLERGKKYHIKIENVSDAKSKYYMLNTKNKFIRETGVDGWGGKYVFRNLPSDPNEVIEITGDVITVAGNLLVGDQTTKPLANTKVNIVDQNGNIVQTVVTNAFGSFVFTNLPSDKTYIVKVDEKDVQLVRKSKIILTNKSGQEIQTTNADKEGAFTFSLLASDKTVLKRMEVEDVDLRIEFKGKFVGDDKKPLANTVVNVVNDRGEILQTTKTDETGAFFFENLPSDQHYLIKIDEKDPQLKRIKKVVLTNSKGDVVKEVKTVENPEAPYSFSFLPSEKTKLTTVYVDDPWLKVLKLKNSKVSVAAKQNVTIVENVYYGYGEYRMPAEANKILDKVINLMESDPDLLVEIASHTDSRSSKEYNLSLSEKRANAAVDYIVKNGINKARISGKGYGESKLINNCADGVDCSEEDHAKNRRTEFQVARKKKP